MEQGTRLAGLILAITLLQGKGPLGGLTVWRRVQGKKPSLGGQEYWDPLTSSCHPKVQRRKGKNESSYCSLLKRSRVPWERWSPCVLRNQNR